MKPTYKVRGVLRIYERLRTSANGNPRYCVQIGKYLYRTRPDSDFAYSVPDLDGKFVEVTVNEYHGWPSILYGGLATSLGNGRVEDGTPMAQAKDPSYDLQELPHSTAGRKAPPVPDESIGCPESGTLDYALLLGFYEYLMVKPSKRQVVPRCTDWQLSYDNGAALARAYQARNEEEE